MSAHTLTWPEITTLLSALGLVTTAAISFLVQSNPAARRKPQALRVPVKPRPGNTGCRD